MKPLIHATLLSLFLTAFVPLEAQSLDIEQIVNEYDQYRESALTKRRIKHYDVHILIQRHRSSGTFEIQRAGSSMQGRPLYLISFGEGETDVFLWSQMHGDEPTATQAIFDLLNYFEKNWESPWVQQLRSSLRLHFLPMLNPDGAQVFTRRTALGIDLNRDALRLQAPEGRLLKRIRDSLDADFGFNLHDQSKYYNVERTPNTASISFLAPPFNYEKDINEVRRRSLQLIVAMNRVLQQVVPGQVGRYSDDFEPRAFGDNIQKWGSSTILIESGGFRGDPERQEVRKLNYLILLKAFESIVNGDYANLPLEEYESIPPNDRKLFDLKIENITHLIDGKPYQLDIGINRYEKDDAYHDDFHIEGRIEDVGDLSTFYGYETFDASGYRLVEPGVTRDAVEANPGKLFVLNDFELLKKGYGYVRMKGIARDQRIIRSPINGVRPDFKLPVFRLRPGAYPTFFLQRDGKLTHAVVNGFLIDLTTERYGTFRNALVID